VKSPAIETGVWTEDLVRSALARSALKHASPGHFRLQLLSVFHQVGVGCDEMGALVVILPPQPVAEAFVDRFLSFEAWTNTRDEITNEDLACSVLRCSYPDITEDELTAISFIFHALIILGITSEDPSNVGRRIHALRTLFDSRMQADVAPEIEVGLFGELLVIERSRVMGAAVACWHSGPQDSYDFSRHASRVDVKTTRSPERIHSFSSTQVGKVVPYQVVFFSIQVNIVEVGTTVSELFASISSQLSEERHRAKLIDVCTAILGTHPRLVSSLKVDIQAAHESIAAFEADEIPYPVLSSGVLSATWRAQLPEKPNAELPDVMDCLL
jgi:Putative  PD-(D/E)XK family member, (DUF4420)